jgi:xanthine dehydrogenase accessory factor
MNEENYWKTTLEELKQGRPVVLIIIIERIGSGPNIPGAKMFVTSDSAMGTVGGGNSEYILLNQAKTLLRKNNTKIEIVNLEHTDTAETDSSGMICSGSQRFALVNFGKEDIETILQIITSMIEAKPGVLTINNKGINFKFTKILKTDRIFSEEETHWSYQENIGIQDRLFIIGGGHVSLALSRVMETLGFHITVIDDRENLPTMLKNTYAHKKIVESYENIPKLIPEGNNVYVTIMTYGHISDEIVLEAIISKKCRYMGMMASSSKKKQVFTNLMSRGISETLLNKIHSPIGVKIKSHTPEEIAISIAAEIIGIKNKTEEQ